MPSSRGLSLCQQLTAGCCIRLLRIGAGGGAARGRRGVRARGWCGVLRLCGATLLDVHEQPGRAA